MKRRALVFLAAVAALLLSAGRASAEQDAGVGLRLGGSFEGGPLVVPGVVTFGIVGAELHGGAQLNSLMAVYLTVGGGVLVGEPAGRNWPFSLLVEFTFNDTISVSAGPALNAFDAATNEILAEGWLGGGRLHLTFCPAITRRTYEDLRRRGLTFGADLRLLAGTGHFVQSVGYSPKPLIYRAPPLIMPMLSIGYQFF